MYLMYLFTYKTVLRSKGVIRRQWASWYITWKSCPFWSRHHQRCSLPLHDTPRLSTHFSWLWSSWLSDVPHLWLHGASRQLCSPRNSDTLMHHPRMPGVSLPIQARRQTPGMRKHQSLQGHQWWPQSCGSKTVDVAYPGKALQITRLCLEIRRRTCQALKKKWACSPVPCLRHFLLLGVVSNVWQIWWFSRFSQCQSTFCMTTQA